MLRYSALVFCGALLGWSLTSPLRVADETAARAPSTPQQARVLAVLDQPSEFDFGEQPLEEAVAFLEQKHHIPIQFDRPALHDADIACDAPVSATLNGVSLRSVLKRLLGPLDLTYVACDGYLLVTTMTAAENRMPLRVYPVEDLVTTDSEFRSPLDLGAPADLDFQGLTEVITCAIAPTTWDEVGGPGSLSKCGNTGILAVSQTDEVHEQIASLLAALRRVRDKQIAAARSGERFGLGRTHDPDRERNLEARVYRFYQPPTPADAAANPAKRPTDASGTAADEVAAAKLDAWTKVIAGLVPQMIAPETWKPAGDGQILATSGMIVVRQSPDLQIRVAKLIYEMMLPGAETAWYPLATFYRCYAPARLSMPYGKVKWPEQAEPTPRGAETRLLAALGEQGEVDFADEPLDRLLAALARRHKIQIQIDHKALAAAGIDDDVRVTRAFRGLPLKPALELALDELGLTGVCCDEMLLVTSKAEAENMLVTKVYPVFDLVVRRRGASSRTPAVDFSPLIDSITTNLAPTTWGDVGGPGAIQPFTNAGALVVSQTPDIHEQLASFLRAMRETAPAPK